MRHLNFDNKTKNFSFKFVFVLAGGKTYLNFLIFYFASSIQKGS